jgi:hypothetical protein
VVLLYPAVDFCAPGWRIFDGTIKTYTVDVYSTRGARHFGSDNRRNDAVIIPVFFTRVLQSDTFLGSQYTSSLLANSIKGMIYWWGYAFRILADLRLNCHTPRRPNNGDASFRPGLDQMYILILAGGIPSINAGLIVLRVSFLHLAFTRIDAWLVILGMSLVNFRLTSVDAGLVVLGVSLVNFGFSSIDAGLVVLRVSFFHLAFTRIDAWLVVLGMSLVNFRLTSVDAGLVVLGVSLGNGIIPLLDRGLELSASVLWHVLGISDSH